PQSAGPVSRRQWWNHLPRRNRRNAALDAAHAAARVAGRGDYVGRRYPPGARRRASLFGHQSRSSRGGGGGNFPRRPLLSPRRLSDPPASVADAPARYSAARGSIYDPRQRAPSEGNSRPRSYGARP